MAFRDRIKKASQVGAFFVAAGLALPAMACPPPGPLEPVAVKAVIDGDTLLLGDGRKVRLIGLNTPELGREGRLAEPFAEQARERLRELVRESGGRVSLSVGRDARDRYGRTLAHAYDSRGENLEAALLAEGLGYYVAIPPNVALTDCLVAREKQARSGGRGLWQRPLVQPAAAIHRSGFAVVQVDIVRVEQNRGGIWLETADDFVINVPRKADSAFDHDALVRLAGQRVEVRGWVVERHQAKRGARWLLPLTHPAMLQPVSPGLLPLH